MNFEIAKSCVFTKLVTADPRHPKKLSYFPEKVEAHAVLEISTQSGDVDLSMKYGAAPADTIFYRPEQVHFLTLLKPKFLERPDEATIVFAFGQDDGPPRLGVPSTAATFRMTFSKKNKPSDYQPYTGDKIAIDERRIDGGWVLNLINGDNAPTGSTDCLIEMISDQPIVPDIEEYVVLHVLDPAGRLLCTVEKGENNRFTLDYQDSFQLLCPIRYSQSGQDPIVLTYAIGDPRTDAKVTIVEEDAEADIFDQFTNLVQSTIQWFQNRFSS